MIANGYMYVPLSGGPKNRNSIRYAIMATGCVNGYHSLFKSRSGFGISGIEVISKGVGVRFADFIISHENEIILSH